MIIFLQNRAHGYTHKPLVGWPGLPKIKVKSYDWALRRKRLPSAVYIFTDRERMDPWEMRVLGALFRHINGQGDGCLALNDPAMVLGRRGLLRALAVEEINPFNAYAVSERQWPRRYPVFIRREYDHGRPLTGLIETADELKQAIEHLKTEGEPEEGLLITEYCAQPVGPDLFRKLSAYRVGCRLFFYNTVHEASWLVKYGTKNAATEALYREERQMIENNAFRAELAEIFAVAGIDYGRIDFGLVDGRIAVYEINTNPSIKPPGDHPNETRLESMRVGWQKYCDALRYLDQQATGSRSMPQFDHVMLHRGLSLLPGHTRSRIVRP